MSPSENSTSRRRLPVALRPWLFPLLAAGLYGLGFALAPQGADRALHAAGGIFRQVALPLCLALCMMVALNRYLSPVLAARFLGCGSGLRGVVLSSLAGILSMGPVYAWYPLFRTLRDKGASAFHMANFITSRAVKPVLLPVVVAAFGWRFAALFVLAGVAGALLVAGMVALACPGFGAVDDGRES